jgi:hypothetical protein
MKEFERMQKLAFGNIIPALKNIQNPPMSLIENILKDKIKELVHSSLGEAKKKKKEEDVAPQEDIDFEMDAETSSNMAPEDTMSPETSVEVDIDPKVKAIQDALNKALANAQALNDEKLIQQIGNTITMLVRTQVVGQQAVAENLEEVEYESADFTRGYDTGYQEGYRDGFDAASEEY